MAPAKLIPLKDARWAFASQRLRKARDAAREAPIKTKLGQLSSTEIEARRKRASEDPGEAIKLLSDSYDDMVAVMRVRSAPELAAEESLLQKLQEGKLEACGVQSAPKQRRQLEVLPAHFFVDAKIGWIRNKVTNFGVTYSAVRVRRPSVAGAGRPREEAPNTFAMPPASTPAKPVPELLGNMPRRKPGPPSAAKEVIAAYDLMLQKGDIKKGMTVKAIYQRLLPILERNSTMFPNGRGLAYSSIARHLSPHLRSKFSS